MTQPIPAIEPYPQADELLARARGRGARAGRALRQRCPPRPRPARQSRGGGRARAGHRGAEASPRRRGQLLRRVGLELEDADVRAVARDRRGSGDGLGGRADRLSSRAPRADRVGRRDRAHAGRRDRPSLHAPRQGGGIGGVDRARRGRRLRRDRRARGVSASRHDAVLQPHRGRDRRAAREPAGERAAELARRLRGVRRERAHRLPDHDRRRRHDRDRGRLVRADQRVRRDDVLHEDVRGPQGSRQHAARRRRALPRARVHPAHGQGQLREVRPGARHPARGRSRPGADGRCRRRHPRAVLQGPRARRRSRGRATGRASAAA